MWLQEFSIEGKCQCILTECDDFKKKKNGYGPVTLFTQD